MAILFVLLALLGVPLFAIFGGVALHGHMIADIPSLVIISEFYKMASQPVLLTIPLFTFAGYVLAESGAPTRMIDVAKQFVGWMPGGLVVVTILSCALFTAYTGASGVTIIALGGLLYPILMKEGFGDKFSMGLVTSCGSIGLLFPPSLPLILYGLVASNDPENFVAIDKLFVAGALPGYLIISILSGYGAYVFSRNQGGSQKKALSLAVLVPTLLCLMLGFLVGLLHFVKGTLGLASGGLSLSTGLLYFLIVYVFAVLVLAKLFPKSEIVQSQRRALWEIPLPILIMVGIYGGKITVSEASAFAAAWVLIVEIFIYKDVTFKQLPKLVTESMTLVGGILIILGVAMGVTNLLVNQEIPYRIFNAISPYITSKWTFLVVLNLFLLVVGCMMDIFSAVIVVVPIIAPIARKFGVDPVHLAVIFLTNLEIGYLTPPVGLNLFISSFRFNRNVIELYRIAIPFLILMLIALMVITYVPWLSLGPLEMMGL